MVFASKPPTESDSHPSTEGSQPVECPCHSCPRNPSICHGVARVLISPCCDMCHLRLTQTPKIRSDVCAQTCSLSTSLTCTSAILGCLILFEPYLTPPLHPRFCTYIRISVLSYPVPNPIHPYDTSMYYYISTIEEFHHTSW